MKKLIPLLFFLSMDASASLINLQASGNLISIIDLQCTDYDSPNLRCNSNSQSQVPVVVQDNVTFTDSTPFSFSFDYDTDAQISRISYGNTRYSYWSPLSNFDLSLGSFSPSTAGYSPTTSSLSVANNFEPIPDLDSLFFVQNWTQNNWKLIFHLGIEDRTGVVFDGNSIPESIDPDDFQSMAFTLHFQDMSNGNLLSMSGPVSLLSTSSAATPVPVPAAFYLMLGPLGIATVRRLRLLRKD